MSPAILAGLRLHFPSSLWGRVLFTNISLGMQPQGQSALQHAASPPGAQGRAVQWQLVLHAQLCTWEGEMEE